MIPTDLVIGTFIGAAGGSLATIAANHILQEIEKDRTEIYRPIYRELQRISRTPDKGPKSLRVLSAFPSSEITSIEDEGKLLPRKHKGLRKDMEQLRNLRQSAETSSASLASELDVEIHLAIEDMLQNDPEGEIRTVLNYKMEYFIRCELIDTLSKEDEHAWRTLAYRAARNDYFEGKPEVLRSIVESIVSQMKKLFQNDLERRDGALRKFYTEVEEVKAGLEATLRSKGFSRYKHGQTVSRGERRPPGRGAVQD